MQAFPLTSSSMIGSSLARTNRGASTVILRLKALSWGFKPEVGLGEGAGAEPQLSPGSGTRLGQADMPVAVSEERHVGAEMLAAGPSSRGLGSEREAPRQTSVLTPGPRAAPCPTPAAPPQPGLTATRLGMNGGRKVGDVKALDAMGKESNRAGNCHPVPNGLGHVPPLLKPVAV